MNKSLESPGSAHRLESPHRPRSPHRLGFLLVIGSAVLPLFVLGARHLPAIETALIGSADAPLALFGSGIAMALTPLILLG